jgi:hypothetical protein
MGLPYFFLVLLYSFIFTLPKNMANCHIISLVDRVTTGLEVLGRKLLLSPGTLVLVFGEPLN